ncbi:methyltransferase family protein [Streptomyces sp. 846.5]|nr:class I SAM-dependent methyltransferase [Streptomyces sp. 846.5]TDT94052.1 methyltransferase family protein [Streptomyces sp. 846.5]
MKGIKTKLRGAVEGGPNTLRSVFIAQESRRRSLFEQSVAQLGTGTRNKNNRDQWLAKALADVRTGSRILDAGAGELQYEPLCRHLDYVSQDFAQYDGSGDATGLQTETWDSSRLDIICDITAIPEPDASFDAVLCAEVLEHVPRPIDALQEFARLLRPGGELIVSTPVSSLTHFAPYYFYNGYSRYFYRTHLPALGLEVIEISANGDYFQFVAQEVVRADEVARRYTPRRTSSRLDDWVTLALLRRLRALSAADTGSHELLAHGLHVRARKT